MDSREVRNLMEAYLDVYASEKELNSEGFELWVDALLDEGYDLSDYTWDEVYEAYTELLESERQRYKPDPTSTGYGTPEQMNRKPEDRRIPNKDTAEWLRKDAKTKKYGRPMRDFQPGVIKRRDIERQGIRTIPQVVRRNPDEFKPVPILQNNSYNYYDAVLAHLVNEGYADNFDSAIKIMVNMSEEWRDEILDEGVPLRGTTPDGKPWRVDPSSVKVQPEKMRRNPKAKDKEPNYKTKQERRNKSDSRYEQVEYVGEDSRRTSNK
jgi:hypothetical protein